MSIKTLETLVADRLDAMVLRHAALKAQHAGPAAIKWSEMQDFETNGLCLALRAIYAEDGVHEEDHFPSPCLIAEEWRNAHRSLM